MSSSKSKKGVGIRVAHDFNDFVEDREVILTLKDSYILDNQDVRDDNDVLENVNMAEEYRHQVHQETRKKKGGFLEEKYGGEGEKKLLPQYDEISTEKEGFVLDSTGEYNLDRIRKIESIKSKLSAPNKKGNEISLETTSNIASEYFTSEEMKKFKKPMKKAPIMQKNKEDILKFLEESLGDTNENHGNRDARKAKEKADLEDAVVKKQKTENYETALSKAREQSAKQTAYMDEEYEEIQRAIENQRRAAMKGKKSMVEDVVRTLIDTNTTANQIDNKNVIVLNNAKKKPTDGEFVELDTINTGTDFLKIVSTKEEITEQKMKILEPLSKGIKDTRDGTTSIVHVALPSEKILAWNKANSSLASTKPLKKEVPPNKVGEKGVEEEENNEDEIEKLADEVQFINEDSLAGGLSNALKAAREKGYLLESEVEVVGRRNDKTYREELSKFVPSNSDRIRLEYRDRQGRIMTPKEAFRYLCRTFHGIAPSKNKQEKERKKMEAARKSLSTHPQESASMKALNILKTQSNQAFVVLDTNKNQK